MLENACKVRGGTWPCEMRLEAGGRNLFVGGGIIATSRDMPPKLQRETSM